MAAIRDINTEEQWKALAVGALAQVHYFEIDEQGLESDTLTMHVIRVDGDFRANAGDYWLAGGKWWDDIWNWQQGVAVVQLAEVLSDPVFGPNALPEDPIQAAEAVVQAAATERSAPSAVVGRLLDLGWRPPVNAPEGTQVWTITGTPAKVHHMNGTQAYMSLPNGLNQQYEDRGDIVLDNPVVTVVNERLRTD